MTTIHFLILYLLVPIFSQDFSIHNHNMYYGQYKISQVIQGNSVHVKLYMNILFSLNHIITMLTTVES